MQMASSPKFVCLFFLLTTLVFSLQTYARDSHYFSRVTRNRDEDASTTTTTPNTNKFLINNKQSDEFEPLNKQEEAQPAFLPQTTESGYGLYGHETGLDPPSTTSTTTSLYNMDDNTNNNNNNRFDNFNNYYKNNNENNHHEKNYAPELKGMSSTTYSTNANPSKFINNNNNNRYNNNNYNSNNYNNNDEGMYYGVRHNGMQEKQGMSDTRFLENGKYYYDVNNEAENYDPNNNYMSYSNNNNHNNNYETNGYYGNKDEAYYGNHYNNNNNNNNFFHGNGMKGYHRNQIPQDERFDFDDQP